MPTNETQTVIENSETSQSELVERNTFEKVFDCPELTRYLFSFFRDSDFPTTVHGHLAYSVPAKTHHLGLTTVLTERMAAMAAKLLTHVVKGELDNAKAMIENNPRLLLIPSEAIDYSGRTIKGTAFQAALCAMDDELCAMLAQHMTQEDKARQYQEIFPEGHEACYQAQKSFDFSQIVETISQSNDTDIEKALRLELPNTTLLWQKLEQFRTNFTTQSCTEPVFNPQHLIKAFGEYDSQFDSWRRDQRDLFWRQVIGYVQRFLPANIAMDFAQGLYSRVQEKKKSNRSFNFTYGGGAIFPLDFASLSGCGYEFGAGGGCGRRVGIVGRSVGSLFFATYVKQKQQLRENYAARIEPQPYTPLSNSVK